MTAEEVQKAVEAAEEACNRAYFDIAEQIFNEHVKPFCEKRGWGFLAGNGTYCFFDEDGDAVFADDAINIDDEDAEEDLYDEEFQEINENFCSVVVETGNGSQDLGSIMPDHETTNVKGYKGAVYG